MARAILALCVAALVCSGSSAAARTSALAAQEVTITGGGGVQLACGFVLPDGTAPDGGWPGIVFFPRLGLVHAYEEDGDQTLFAADGFASVSCDERGTGASGGSFDLAGPNDAEDAQAIFDWLVAQPNVSPTEIGAYGEDLGGAEVWNAAVAGVPFKAIVPAYTWSSLGRALKPTGAVNVGTLSLLTAAGPSTAWNTPAGIAARSYRGRIHSLTVPTLIIQRRKNLHWDLSQATTAYRLLSGPKRLSVVWSLPQSEVEAWFSRYLTDGDPVGGGVEIQHENPNYTITKFLRFPSSRSVIVNLPGSALQRSVWLTGGPLETFGAGSVTIRYTDASWEQVVATVSTGRRKGVTEGAAPVKSSEGVLTIPLLNEAVFMPRRKVTVTLSSHDATFGGATTGTITVSRVTLRLSVLGRAVSN